MELACSLPLEHKWGLNVVRVAAGGNHSAILTRRAQVYVCGQGTHGANGKFVTRAPLVVPWSLHFCAFYSSTCT